MFCVFTCIKIRWSTLLEKVTCHLMWNMFFSLAMPRRHALRRIDAPEKMGKSSISFTWLFRKMEIKDLLLTRYTATNHLDLEIQTKAWSTCSTIFESGAKKVSNKIIFQSHSRHWKLKREYDYDNFNSSGAQSTSTRTFFLAYCTVYCTKISGERERSKCNVIILRKITICVHGIWNEEKEFFLEKRGTKRVLYNFYGQRVSSILIFISRKFNFLIPYDNFSALRREASERDQMHNLETPSVKGKSEFVCTVVVGKTESWDYCLLWTLFLLFKCSDVERDQFVVRSFLCRPSRNTGC